MRLRHKVINTFGGIDGFKYPETDTELYAGLTATFMDYAEDLDKPSILVAIEEAIPDNPLESVGIDTLTVPVHDAAAGARETASNAREAAANARERAAEARERVSTSTPVEGARKVGRGIKYVGTGLVAGAKGAAKVARKLNRARKKVQAFISTCWDLGVTAGQIVGTLLTIAGFIIQVWYGLEAADAEGSSTSSSSGSAGSPHDNYDAEDWAEWVRSQAAWNDKTMGEAIREAEDHSGYDIEHLIRENEEAGDYDDDDVIDI